MQTITRHRRMRDGNEAAFASARRKVLMQVLIVQAHPEPASFNAALTRAATDALQSAGHAVTVSDLYAEGFNATADRHDFTTIADPSLFHYQSEQAYACCARRLCGRDQSRAEQGAMCRSSHFAISSLVGCAARDPERLVRARSRLWVCLCRRASRNEKVISRRGGSVCSPPPRTTCRK